MASTRIADHIGRVLGGRYRILAAIGTGASAHVFVATDSRLGRRVAVKILHPALATDPAFLKRFGAEARAAAALNHPNILAVYDWGEEADGPYLVTEYLGGGSLRAMLDRGLRLTPSQALLVGLETARGLDYAHRRGIVHRDVKPANLIFDDDGRLRIADFGLARALAEAAWTEPEGVALGTARYAAPEQARGLPVDGRADVYSLALVLIESVSGRVPFLAESTVGTLMNRLERAPEVPPELGALAAAIERAGHPDPDRRVDAMAFGAALQAVAADLPPPRPLPLPGPAALDDSLGVMGPDATELGRARAPAGLVGGQVGAGAPMAFSAGRAPVPVPPAPTRSKSQQSKSQQSKSQQSKSQRSRPRRGEPRRGDAGRPGSEDSAFLSPAAGRRHRRWPTVLAVLIVLAGGGAGGWYAVQSRIPAHLVPDVRPSSEAEATATLRALRFQVESRRERADGTRAGQVLRTQPATGASVKEGRAVLLFVSEGPTLTSVPDLSGLSDGQAADRLRSAGLVVDTDRLAYQSDEQVPKDFVISWDPRSGSPEKGTPVALTLSKGPAPRAIPSLAGTTFDQARAELATKGLVAVRSDAFSDTVAEGFVVSTAPPAGSEVARGSSVTVVVSRGQPVVPNLNGKSRDEATALLTAAGLRLGAVYGPGGTVFLSTPLPGTRVQTGSTVSIYIG